MANQNDTRASDISDFSFLVALADADFLDDWELTTIKNLALEDGVIDEKEKTVLRNVFRRLRKENMSLKAWRQLERFKVQYNI